MGIVLGLKEQNVRSHHNAQAARYDERRVDPELSPLIVHKLKPTSSQRMWGRARSNESHTKALRLYDLGYSLRF